MSKYLSMVACVVLLSGCVSTGVGASFSPAGGVRTNASFCLDTGAPSFYKFKDALNKVGNLGNVFDTATSLFHCVLPLAPDSPMQPEPDPA